jgi:hypothetical protein
MILPSSTNDGTNNNSELLQEIQSREDAITVLVVANGFQERRH